MRCKYKSGRRRVAESVRHGCFPEHKVELLDGHPVVWVVESGLSFPVSVTYVTKNVVGHIDLSGHALEIYKSRYSEDNLPTRGEVMKLKDECQMDG